MSAPDEVPPGVVQPSWLTSLGRVAWESGPALVSASVAAAAAGHSGLRVYAAIVAGAVGYATVQRAIFGRRAYEDRVAVAAQSEIRRDSVERLILEQAGKISTLLVVLGDTTQLSDSRQAGKSLIATVAESVKECCGRMADGESRIEAAYYTLAPAGDLLERNYVSNGYSRAELPDQRLVVDTSRMVEHAGTGSGVLLEHLPENPAGMAVRMGAPVSTGGAVRGILFVESTSREAPMPAAMIRLPSGRLKGVKAQISASMKAANPPAGLDGAPAVRQGATSLSRVNARGTAATVRADRRMCPGRSGSSLY